MPLVNDVIRARDALAAAETRHSRHLRVYRALVNEAVRECHARRRALHNASTVRVGDVGVDRVFLPT